MLDNDYCRCRRCDAGSQNFVILLLDNYSVRNAKFSILGLVEGSGESIFPLLELL